MPEFTIEQKIRSLQRELNLRGKVFPKLIAANKMTEEFAARELRIFSEIITDYQSQANQLLLFEEKTS